MEEHHLSYLSEEGEMTDIFEGSQPFTLDVDTSLPQMEEPREASRAPKPHHMSKSEDEPRQ